MELGQTRLSSCSDMDVSELLDQSIRDSSERLNSAKSELAANLRKIVLLRRQLDELPIQAELIQYEHRISELHVQIQGKHRQTHSYYATYNSLIEIRDLMLKETSLLNSISSQFQDAITSTAGRTKLIDFMEAILKGTQQKLDNVKHNLQDEQKACRDLRERYASTFKDQRRSPSLVEDFQLTVAVASRPYMIDAVDLVWFECGN